MIAFVGLICDEKVSNLIMNIRLEGRDNSLSKTSHPDSQVIATNLAPVALAGHSRENVVLNGNPCDTRMVNSTKVTALKELIWLYCITIPFSLTGQC